MTIRSRTQTSRKRRGYHHGDLRRALVDAALRLLREQDVGAVSLRAVAREAGVTAAAPYHHFEDKNALLAAVAEEGFRALNARMEETLAAAGPSPQARLKALATCYARFAAEHPAHYRVMFRPELADPSAYPEKSAEADKAYQCLLTWAAEARAASGAREDARDLAITVWSWVHGLVFLWNEGPLRFKSGDGALEPLLERTVKLLGRILGGGDKR